MTSRFLSQTTNLATTLFYLSKQADLENDRMSKFFKPNHFKWVIVVNEKYDKKRKIKGFEGFKDIPEVKNDLKKRQQLIRLLSLLGKVQM